MNRTIVIATTNDNKVKEYKHILSPLGFNVLSFRDLNINLPEVNEDGKTFKDNALIKALSAAKLTSYPVIADDSGLNVKALNNFPGIYSSRFAKQCNGFLNANYEIVKRVSGLNKEATFHCAIALVNYAKEPLVFEAEAKGLIINKYNGETSFGYDPIFWSIEAKDTYHNISKDIKDKISHRAKACKLLVDYLSKN